MRSQKLQIDKMKVLMKTDLAPFMLYFFFRILILHIKFFGKLKKTFMSDKHINKHEQVPEDKTYPDLSILNFISLGSCDFHYKLQFILNAKGVSQFVFCLGEEYEIWMQMTRYTYCLHTQGFQKIQVGILNLYNFWNK